MGILILTLQFKRDGTLTKTGPKIYMVTEKSATSTGLTATADEYNIPLNTDHSGLVTYKSRSQEDYSIVKETLKKFVAQAKWEVDKRFVEKSTLYRKFWGRSTNNWLSDLTPEQERSWRSLNQPPYTSFRNSSKIAKPEKGTLEWLVREEGADRNVDFRNRKVPQQSLRMEDLVL